MYGYIYLTQDLLKNKIYIGQKRSKKFLGIKYVGSGVIIRDIKKHCKKVNMSLEKRFDVKLLCECLTQVELNEKEIYYINLYDSQNRELGYNILAGGEGSRDLVHSEKTKKIIGKHSDILWSNSEHRKKMSDRIKGDNNPAKNSDVRRKISERQMGHAVSNEQRQKQSESMKGRVLSQEHKNKISASNLGKNVGDKNGTFGKPAWNRGVGMSKEWREKLSEAKKGRVWVTNEIVSCLIQKEQLQEYIRLGYRLGRVLIKKTLDV